MFDHTLSADEIERIRRERAEADTQYNDALTVVDRAIVADTSLPDPPPPPDEAKVAALSDGWRILSSGAPGPARGWKGRLAAFVWRMIGPILERQEHFNASLVEHLNRTVAGERAARETLGRTLLILHDRLAALARFESLLVQFLQQITPYVDTKDRAMATAILQNLHQQLGHLEQSIALIQQQQVALRREVARLSTPTVGPPAPAPSVAQTPDPRAVRSAYAAADAYKYLCFEGAFRGTEASIRRRLADYGPYFDGAADVLDVGCGRGEFLDLLRERGVRARGLDPNREMVEQCRTRGLEVTEGDAVAHLEGLEDGSLGGLFAGQVVEHLEAAYLVRFLGLAYEKLRPGSKIVVETINADCWSAFFGPYLHDITHAHALPPDTLRFLLQASGFQRMQVFARSPVADDLKLRRLSPEVAATMDADLAAAFNANADRLNGLLFTHTDYAIVGERL